MDHVAGSASPAVPHGALAVPQGAVRASSAVDATHNTFVKSDRFHRSNCRWRGDYSLPPFN